MSFLQPPRKRKCFLEKTEPSSVHAIDSPTGAATPVSESSLVLPADKAFAALVQHVVDLASQQHCKQLATAAEKEDLQQKLAQAEVRIANLESSPPKLKSPTAANKLEQRNRELQRSLDLVRLDLTQCSGLLKNAQSDYAKKDDDVKLKDKEIETMKQELAQTKSRLDSFVKSASEQALLAKSVQEELKQERDVRQQIEDKLRGANECVMLGMEIEKRLKAITQEKKDLEVQLQELRAENLRLLSQYGGSANENNSNIEVEEGGIDTARTIIQVNNQTQTVVAYDDEEKEDEIARLQILVDELRQRVNSSSTKSTPSSEVPPSFFSTRDSIDTSSICLNASEVPSSPDSALQSENTGLRRKVSELEEELHKRHNKVDFHQRTWNQKCEQLRMLEERVRDRDIQCAKYHYELQNAERKIRSLSERISLSSTSTSSSPSFPPICDGGPRTFPTTASEF